MSRATSVLLESSLSLDPESLRASGPRETAGVTKKLRPTSDIGTKECEEIMAGCGWNFARLPWRCIVCAREVAPDKISPCLIESTATTE